MKNLRRFLLLALIFLAFGCSSIKKNILQETLASDNPKIKTVMSNPELFELQIIYTQIIRGKNNSVSFKDFTYHLNTENYFYPASTIKLPIAILALEKLNTIENTSNNTQYSIEGNPNKLQFSKEISKVFAVSDNEASSNLFEFLGFDTVNESMKTKGLQPFRLSHRLSGSNPRALATKPITIYKDDGSVLTVSPIVSKPSTLLQLNNIKKGNGYMKNDSLVKTSFDFSSKNYFPLETLHNTLKRVVFPETFKESERFKLTEKDREFILFSMQNPPKNAGYDPVEYYDGYCKFFMFGDTKENIPENLKIYNKVGFAYGTITDSAYIVDSKNNVEFMISATLLVNSNKTFNDNVYEYDSIGLPFLGELGRQLYAKNLKQRSK